MHDPCDFPCDPTPAEENETWCRRLKTHMCELMLRRGGTSVEDYRMILTVCVCSYGSKTSRIKVYWYSNWLCCSARTSVEPLNHVRTACNVYWRTNNLLPFNVK